MNKGIGWLTWPVVMDSTCAISRLSPAVHGYLRKMVGEPISANYSIA